MSNETWQRIGADNPFWGVLTEQRFKGALSPELLREFYATGESAVEGLANKMKRHFPTFTPDTLTGLDFGCGVGRLLLPMARRCHRAIGIDVSPGMLREAKRAAEGADIKNIELIAAPKESPTGNWLNSLIVFQHIPLEVGYRLFDELLSKLVNPAYLSVQFTLFKDPSLLEHLPAPLFVKQQEVGEYHLGGVSVSFDRFTADGMSMYDYDLDQIVALLIKHGFSGFHCDIVKMGFCQSVVIFAQRA